MKREWVKQAKSIAMEVKGKKDVEKFKELIACIYDGLKEEKGEIPVFDDVENELRAFLPRRIYMVHGKVVIRLYYTQVRNKREIPPTKEIIIPDFLKV